MSTRSKPETVTGRQKSAVCGLACTGGRRALYQLSRPFQFDRPGDELTGHLAPIQTSWIGNPMLQALHGGATRRFSSHVASLR